MTTTKKTARKLGPALSLVSPPVTRKLDLACGQAPKEGFEGVDLWCAATHRVDLQKYPWPFETSSIDEVHCSHYCEHIPMEYVDAAGRVTNAANGQDALFRFFDELHRILRPDGWATIIVPNARSNRGFQDPTHRRFFVAETFLYFFAEWRALNRLDHYRVDCNFAGDVVPIIPIEYNALSSEVQTRKFTHEWNTVLDWQAKLKAIKPTAP